MAKLSPTMETGQMVKWLVKVGDPVKEGDTLAEIQTDKAVMPMESFDEGVVARLDVQEGDDIALGQRVLLLAAKGEDPKAVAQQAGSGSAAAKPKAAPAKAEEPASEPVGASAGVAGSNGHEQAAAPGGRTRSTPLARKIASEADVSISSVPGSGP